MAQHVRNGLKALVATMLILAGMVVASRVHAARDGQFRPVIQRGPQNYERVIDPAFRVVCIRRESDRSWESTMSCVRY